MMAAASDFVYQIPVNGANFEAATPGALQLSPDSHSFGTLVLGSSAAVTTMVRNTGQDAVHVAGIEAQAPYAQSNNCPSTLIGGASCTISVTYVPTSAGSFPSAVTVNSDVGNISFPVSGSAVVPTTTLQLAPSSVDFGAVDVNVSATPKSVTVTNTGNSPATVNGIGVTSGTTDFSQANNCGDTLAPGASCTISLGYKPIAYGARAGNLSVYEQASGTLYSVALTGSGNAAILAAASSSKDFGAAVANYANKSAQVTFQNNGNLPVTGLSADVSAGDFSQIDTTCGSSIAPGASCLLNVKFAPTAAGPRTATVLVQSANGGSASVALTGTGIAQNPSVALSSTAVTFPDTTVATSSPAQTVTLTNNGNVNVAVTGVAISAGATNFQSTSTCGASLAVGASCAASVVFSPSQSGAQVGTLKAQLASGDQSVSLSGTGLQGAATLSSSSLTFAATQVAATSTAQTVTVTNTGNKALTFTGVGVASGATDFAQSNNCAVVAPAGTCTVQVTFTPTTTGARSGALALVHDGQGATVVSLSGTGQAPSATLSTPSFAATPVGSSSVGVATLTNTGIGALTITTPAASSVTGADFSYSATTCPASLAAGASCSVSVKFAPTSTTARTGQLTVSTLAGAKSVTLGSTGIQGFASMSPGSLTFATQQKDSTSAAQTVTVTNTGTDTLVFTGVGISTGATDFAQSNNCGSVAVGATCAVSVSFTPTAAGSRTGTLAFTHNGGGIATVSLTGTGQVASATLTTPSFSSAQVGSTTTAASTLTNTGIGVLTLGAPTVAGTDFGVSSTTCGSTLPAGGNCTVTVQFGPSAATSRTGTLSVSTLAGTQSVALNATGVQGTASLSASALSFAAQQVGSPSATQAVTVTNTGTTALVISGVNVSAGAADYSQSNGCSTLAVNASCSITVTFTPSTAGARSGTVSWSHNGSGPTSFSLSGTGQVASASLSTPSFPATPVGSSNTATAVLTNTGIGALSVTVPSAASVSGAAFSFVSTSCTGSVSVGGNCNVVVRFSPTSTSAASGSLSVGTGAGTQTVTLGSTGIQGYASVSPSSLTFSAQQTSTTSGVQTVTVTNTGTNTLTFSGVGISAGGTDFAQSNNCGSVAVSGTCSVSVNFTPAAAGTRTGTLSFTHNGGGIANVSLTGTGQAPSAYITNGGWGSVAVGSSTNGAQDFYNTGIGPISWTATPTVNSPYTYTGTSCANPIPAGSHCSMGVRFSPPAAQTYTQTLSVATTAGTITSTASGTGVQGSASVSSSSLGFGSQTVGATSGSQSVTVTNNGNASLTISGVSVTAGSGDFGQSNNCGTTLAIGASCTITVSFTPAASGARSGSIGYTTNGGGASGFSLSGTGVATASSSIAINGTNGATVTTGSAPTVSWSTSNAASVSVSCSAPMGYSYSGGTVNYGGGGVGTSGTGTSTCSITPYNSLGVAGSSASAVVYVVAAPSVTGVSVGAANVTSGGNNTVNWSTANATSVNVNCGNASSYSYSGGTVNYSGATVTTSGTGTGTCTVTAYNAAGSSSAASASFNVVAAPSVTGISFGTGTITSGNANTVNWSTANATSVAVNCSGTGSYSYSGGTVNYSGAGVGTSGSGTATCSVTAYNAAGSASGASNTFQVVAAPSVTGISFGAGTVTAGYNNTVNWSTANATSVNVNCGNAASYSYSGTTVNYSGATVGTSGTGTGTCTVTAYNAAGNSSNASANFSVVAPASVQGSGYTFFSPGTVTAGYSSTFYWQTSNATSAGVSCSGAGASASGSGTSGSITVGTSSVGQATCTVTAYNAAGNSASAGASLNVVAAPSVTGASFNTSSVMAGNSAIFSWTTGNASSASVSCSGAGAGASGSGTSGSIAVSTSSQGTANCTVTASNAAGNTATGGANLTVTAASPSASVSTTSMTITLTKNSLGCWWQDDYGVYGYVMCPYSGSSSMTVTNSGGGSLTVNTPTGSTNGWLTFRGCGMSLGAGQSCTITADAGNNYQENQQPNGTDYFNVVTSSGTTRVTVTVR